MISNAFEEVISQPINPDVNSAHANLSKEMGLPSWTKSIKCPYCQKVLSETSIRSISLKLNPRNIGDVCVEFLCGDCKVGNTLYFVKAAKNTKDFIKLLGDCENPSDDPITEEVMYKQKYHNTLQVMMSKKET